VAYSANTLNQYTAVGAVTPTYDGNGNLTFDGTLTYGYDAESRLTAVTQGATAVASYAYDAQGRRKLKTVGAATTVYVTDADNREVLEYDGASGQIARWNAYGLGSNDVLAQMNVPAASRATFIPNIQGSILSTLDSATGALTKTGYLPYGKSASVPASFGYTGQRADPESFGLYYYRARMYMPAWGRFMQTDPVGYAAGGNLHAYVDNDPLNLIDPSGKCVPWCIGAASSVAIGYGISLVTGQSYTWQNFLTDAVLGAAGAGLASKLKTAYQLAEAGTGISKARYLGALGEEAVGATDAREGIKIGGRTLFPDIVNPNGLGEVKNVAAISAKDARQISDYAAFSQQGLNPVQVFTREGTDVSRIQGLINSGAVEQKFIPGVNDFGVYSLTTGEAALSGGAVGAADSGVRSLK
jgi:RHS repeat-associated protein